MYTINILTEGIEYLGITDPKQIVNIYESQIENIDYKPESILQVEKLERFWDRFRIPSGLQKKELEDLLAETSKDIQERLEIARKYREDRDKEFLDLEREDLIIKKKKIITTLKLHNSFGTESIAKAKEYPVDELIDFGRSGFARCLWHEEKTGSMHWDKKRNKAHCFGACGRGFDSIDIYQKLNNVDFNTAVKALS